MQEQKVYKVEVSAKTIVFAIFFILFLVLLWIIKDLILTLFVAFIIMSAVKPPVKWLGERKIPRRIATIGVFLFFIVFFIFVLVWVVPPLVGETTLLVKHLPSMIENIHPSLMEYVNISSLSQYAPNITNQAINLIRSIFSNIMFLVTTIFFSIYLTLEEGFIKKTISHFFEEKDVERVVGVIQKTEKRLGAWLLGEFVLMLVVGGMTYAGLLLIGVKYALPLSIIAGLLEVVPNIGPILSTVPAFVVGVTQAPFLGLSTIALYFVVQQLENHIIVPVVMKKVTGLNPIITLIALIIGGRLFGVLGVVLSIPFTLFLQTVLTEALNKKVT